MKDTKLPWIKITPKTKLPKRETNILFFNGIKSIKGRLTGEIFHCNEDGRLYKVSDFTHFMIITNPEE